MWGSLAVEYIVRARVIAMILADAEKARTCQGLPIRDLDALAREEFLPFTARWTSVRSASACTSRRRLTLQGTDYGLHRTITSRSTTTHKDVPRFIVGTLSLS